MLSNQGITFENGNVYHQIQYLGASKKGCNSYKAQSSDGKDVFITTWKFDLESIKRKCPISCAQISIESECSNHGDNVVEAFQARAKFIIENVKHSNLVRYLDVNCEILDGYLTVNLVQEYIEGVSVKCMSDQGILPSLSPIAEWLLKAISYLHSMNPSITHGYINDGSIFLGKSARYHVGDYHLIPYLMYLKGTLSSVQTVTDIRALGSLVATKHEIVDSFARDFIKMCQCEQSKDLLKHAYLSNVHTGDANTIYDGPFLNHFQIIEKLGEGAYGSVLKVNAVQAQGKCGQEYALKLITLPTGSKGKYDKVKREVELISQLNHENVVKYITSWEQTVDALELKNRFDITIFNGEYNSASSYDSSTSANDGPQYADTIIIQMELCEMDLRRAIKKCHNRKESMCRSWLEDIVCGLAYLHSLGIIHRDLNPQNIFLTFNGRMKIADFGLATTIDLILKQRERDNPVTNSANARSSQTGLVGTSYYIAPELRDQEASNATYGNKADIYSLGMIFFEMIHPPFTTDMERHVVLTDAGRKIFPDFMEDSDDPLFIIIKKMLAHEPETRPTADSIVCDFILACLKDEGFEDDAFIKNRSLSLNGIQPELPLNSNSESEYEYDGNESNISYSK
ncbi:eIF-2-alpha kinase GCN2-like [Contarinia nasturtii]|uniref:eIF-2-alpha kinase GCN2-like n=1 Tax=Contarinia nasturtii TaxID=265458 RepID=UPI0012D48615|nr:eIF-2-alpha kinase GCN2-like [Contarinia nasturtii]